mmetsp:Transcript_38501/g.53460  ORF Transcript_38501/g.53460 Transcript_38501/m.53460 type:complete len:156 (-) Transcript_38501:90-557(-)
MFLMLASNNGLLGVNTSNIHTQHRGLLQDPDTQTHTEVSDGLEECSQSCRHGCCNNDTVCCDIKFNMLSPIRIIVSIILVLASSIVAYKVIKSFFQNRRQRQEQRQVEAGEVQVKDQQATAYLVENPDGQAHVAFCEGPNGSFETHDDFPGDIAH